MKIAVDWDGTCEFKGTQKLVKVLLKDHQVEIVTTRYKNPENYPWYREGLDDDIHKKLFMFAKHAGIKVNFTNMEWKGKFLEENKFDVLIDDNIEEKKHLINCQFIPVSNLHLFIEEISK